jgi:hypothetical protein
MSTIGELGSFLGREAAAAASAAPPVGITKIVPGPVPNGVTKTV